MPETHGDAAGTQFGKYFLLKKLAAGGMGEIYVAKQQGPAGFQKIQVVKKILPHLTENKEFIEAFLGEARLAAQMNHRNVVQVFELGEQDGAYFISMEYVAGKSLRDLIDALIKRKEKMHPEIARLTCEQICDGASYAHNLTDMTGRSLNLVHRDLNPQNVLISYTGDVKVIDFGIAKSEMSTVKTEAGMIKGKFVYMSPEQSMAKKLDKRSDIFAIGITLYEMLTGINPFHKNNIVLTLEAVQRYDPPPPSEYDPVYAPFDPIVAKALAKDRDRRYADASEMQDDLRRVVLPRPPERLGQVMQRLFRAALEEEQKIIMDTDSQRLTASGGKKTPAKAVPATTPSKAQPAHQTMPEAESGATMMLPQTPARKPATTPSKPHQVAGKPAAKPPAPPKRPQGAGDTLLDMGSPVSAPEEAPEANDDAPGATAFLKPGMAPPPPPPRKPAMKPTDTMPDASEEAEPPAGATMMLPNAQAARANSSAPKRRPQPPPSTGGTNIMTPEESAEAQKAAAAKMAAAQNQLVRTRQRPEAKPVAAKKSGKGMWIALGVGGLVIVGAIVGLLFWVLQDDAPTARPKKKAAAPAPVEQTQADSAPAAPTEKVAAATTAPAEEPAAKPAPKPKKEEPAEEAKPAPKKTEAAEKPAPKRVASAGKVLGTLNLNPGAMVPVSYGGTDYPKQVGAFNLPLTTDKGEISIGGEGNPYKVTLEYAIAGKIINLKVSSTPWSIVSIDGATKGKTPVADVEIGADRAKPAAVGLGKPGQDPAMTLRLAFKPN